MTEVIAFYLGEKVIRVELSDAEMAAELRPRLVGFEASPDAEPWLVMEIGRKRDDRDHGLRTHVWKNADDDFGFASMLHRGTYRLGTPHRAHGVASETFSIYQMVGVCISLALPHEGGVLLHADTVDWNGRALSFLGRSGTGKTTTATHMLNSGAKPVAIDRTAIMRHDDGRYVVAKFPRIAGEGPRLQAAAGELPLSGVLFPRRGDGVEIRLLTQVEELTRFLSSIIFPKGDDLPTTLALDVAESIMKTVWTRELIYWRGQEFIPALERGSLKI